MFVFPLIGILEPLHVHIVHIAFRWLPFAIGQVYAQVWYRSYLAANLGFFELRTFPWPPSKVCVVPGTLRLDLNSLA